MRFWFCISTVALAGVFALTSQADAAWVPQWGAHMNELSGTLMNDFVANRDGQHKGVHLGVPGPAGYGTAYRFNGVTSAAWRSATGLATPGTRSVRVSVWIKPNGLSQPTPEPDVVKRGYSASSPGYYKVEFLSNNGRASCGFKGTIANVSHVTGGPSVNDGRWHRIVCTKTSTGITLSVDGVVRASHAGNVGSINMSDDLVIGAYRQSSPNFRGDIDEVLIEYFN
jgi:hypothetical protein